MPNAPAIFSASAVTELIKLEGRAKVTYPTADASHRRIERALKLAKARYPLAFNAPDDEYPRALLKAQQKLAEDAQHIYVALRYEELPGAAMHQSKGQSCVDLIPPEFRANDGPWDTIRTKLDPTDTATWTIDPLSPTILSSTLEQASAVEGDKVNIVRANQPWPVITSYRRDNDGAIVTVTRTIVDGEASPALSFNVVGVSVTPLGNGQSLQTLETKSAFPTLLDYRGTGGVPAGGTGFAIEETQRTIVAEGAIPEGFPSTAANVVSDVIHADNLQQAVRELKRIVDNAGADLDATHLPSVNVPLEVDKQTKVQIYRNYRLVSAAQSLPAIGAAFQDGYALDARLTPLGDPPYFSPNAIQEVEWSAIPAPRVEYPMVGFEFPALFKFASASWDTLQFYYTGFPPPWPGDGVTPGTFQLIAHRSATRQARRVYTYSVGASGNAVDTFRVITPGISSRMFQIPSNCIHPPIDVYGTTHGDTYQIEKIPASTPDTYNSADVLTIQCEERQVLGGFFERVVTEISEDTSPYDFEAFFAALGFKATKLNLIDRSKIPKQTLYLRSKIPKQTLYLRSSSAGDTQNATIYGTVGAAYVKKTVTLAGTSTVSTGSAQFEQVFHVHLARNAAGAVKIRQKGIPSGGAIQFTGVPSDGDTVTVGRSVGAQTYTFKTTPASANDIFIAGLTVVAIAQNLAYAINGNGVSGVNYFAGTSAVGNVVAQIDGTDTTIVHVQDALSETNDVIAYTLGSTGSAMQLTAFGTAYDGQELATINPGDRDAYGKINFSNPNLLVYSNSGNLIAVPAYFAGKQTTIIEQVTAASTQPALVYNLPALTNVVSDWLAVPKLPFTITAMLLGNPALTLTYETSTTGTEGPSAPATPGATAIPPIGNSQIVIQPCTEASGVSFVRIKINNPNAQARAIHVSLSYQVVP